MPIPLNASIYVATVDAEFDGHIDDPISILAFVGVTLRHALGSSNMTGITRKPNESAAPPYGE
jgi:hypothetical protein